MKKPFLQRCFATSVIDSSTQQNHCFHVIDLCRSGEFYDAIRHLNSITLPKNIRSKPILYATLLQGSTKARSFTHGLQLHAHSIKSGFETDRFVANSLLALYFKLGRNFSDTRKMFDHMVYKDVVSWTSMISGYIRLGKPVISIEFYIKMIHFGVEPNAYSLSSVIKACAEINELKIGQCFHGVVLKCGFDENLVISCSLVEMYGRNLRPQDSRRVFDEMPQPDSICWTAMISAYTRTDLYGEALELFYKMLRKYGECLEDFTFGSVLTALANLGRVKQGKEMHSKVVTSGLSGNIFVESSLVDMYAKFGLVDESRHVFDRMRERNTVSWCALLSGYCQKGWFDKVIELFRDMDEFELYSFGSVLRACAGLAALKPGKEMHCQYVKRSGWRDVIVESALIDLYAKCGSVDYAYGIFTKMRIKNLITWNSMISGFAQNGRGGEALQVFVQMIKDDIKPDYITFIAVLFSCSHSGLVDEGRKYFALMADEFKIKPGIEHYSCMVDLLGRACEIEEAENLIRTSKFHDDPSLWITLLGACTTNTKPAVAERIAKKTMELKPDYHLSYVLLSNVYRANGRWNDAVGIWKLMRDRGVKKMPGKSWIGGDESIGSLSLESPDLSEEEVV
ncbi:hypothetical protein LIER_06909 [Lithospermum erythrorhizon]|uniref:Pentatricopeptide repeat-containing protein n=1 Tax=Lithospermum erythrorhizon TaxID=34254 RepID=A0AAV3P822_LITER